MELILSQEMKESDELAFDLLHSALQDLELELKKRNLTQDAEETKEILQGLDALPGVSATTTVLPSQDLTPRDVSW